MSRYFALVGADSEAELRSLPVAPAIYCAVQVEGSDAEDLGFMIKTGGQMMYVVASALRARASGESTGQENRERRKAQRG